MKRDQFLFLIGGLAFGILIGLGSYHAIHSTPALDPTLPSESAAQTPRAPAQTDDPNAGGGAPMVERVNQLKRMLQENPNNVQVLRALADMHYDAAMWQQAAGYYERAAELEPNADVLTDLGVCYRGLREFDRALEAFARAHELDPGHWQSLYNTVIVAAHDIGRFDLAEQALATMAAIDPPPPDLDQTLLDRLRESVAALAQAAG
jgi:tetratricopeptide (TPR) repeat protein